VEPQPPAAPLAPLPDKPPYFRFAFANPYNLALLGGSIAASVLTLNPFIGLAGLGLEAIWLVNHDNALLRRLVWDPRFEKMRRAAHIQERAMRLQLLGGTDRGRVQDLIARQADIQRLAAQNPSLTGDLLRNELKKTEKLVDAFVDMAVTSARYDAYLGSVDVEARSRHPRGERTRHGLGPGAQEPGDHLEAPGEDEGDPALPRSGPGTAGPDRELVPADRRSNRDDAVAAGAVRPVERAARRRGVDSAERRRDRRDPEHTRRDRVTARPCGKRDSVTRGFTTESPKP
jgi:hypothetical protein